MTTINECLQIAEEMACASTLDEYKAARGRLKRVLEEFKDNSELRGYLISARIKMSQIIVCDNLSSSYRNEADEFLQAAINVA